MEKQINLTLQAHQAPQSIINILRMLSVGNITSQPKSFVTKVFSHKIVIIRLCNNYPTYFQRQFTVDFKNKFYAELTACFK